MGFATGGKTFFLWGGCMMASNFNFFFLWYIKTKLAFSNYLLYFLQMHAEDFRKDNCGVVSELRNGGYSDDMTLAAIAGESLILFDIELRKLRCLTVILSNSL
jgi:hypothetical protein